MGFSAGMRCTPLTIEVHHRKAIEADLDDNGFQPRIIRIDEGNAVHWRWKDCAIPHQVTLRLCKLLNGFSKKYMDL